MDSMRSPVAAATPGDSSPSQETVEKAKLSKLLIESHYTNMQRDRKDRLMRRKTLEHQMEQLECSTEERKDAIKEFGAKESLFLRISRQRMAMHDFQTIKVIGRGAFGEVRLCRRAQDEEGGEAEMYAIKMLRKKEMRQKDQIAHVRAERDVMRNTSHDNQWLVPLYSSFDDDTYLYLVMHFLPGGDLMTLLQREDMLSHEVTRFYVAQMVLAISSIHNMGYSHRDIKPDNFLLDARGHLALTDFGLCKSFQSTEIIKESSRPWDVVEEAEEHELDEDGEDQDRRGLSPRNPLFLSPLSLYPLSLSSLSLFSLSLFSLLSLSPLCK
mmetsp:Transcript_15628/g.22947  ORF Transcript_15628/g.22947 Transcript_15628/m.22947 type:complete len:326 (+) Transcript_15628:211-1188(+)